MRREFSCLCVYSGGKLKHLNPEMFKHGLSQFGDGEEVEITIAEPGRQRTNKQNRFFHGPIVKAFMSLGYAKQEAKDMLCLMFIPQEVRQLDGTIVRVPGHTSALKVDEFNELIDSCIQLAAEQDIYIEDAGEWRKRHHAA